MTQAKSVDESRASSRQPRTLSTIGAGTELSAPLAKLFEATGRAVPLVCSNLIGVLVSSLLFGNRDERLKDTIKAFTVNKAVE